MSAKTYATDQIRNLAVAGHSGTGKTTLVSALLFDAGVVRCRRQRSIPAATDGLKQRARCGV